MSRIGFMPEPHVKVNMRSQLDAVIEQVLEQLKTAKPIPLRTASAYPTQVGQ